MLVALVPSAPIADAPRVESGVLVVSGAGAGAGVASSAGADAGVVVGVVVEFVTGVASGAGV